MAAEGRAVQLHENPIFLWTSSLPLKGFVNISIKSSSHMIRPVWRLYARDFYKHSIPGLQECLHQISGYFIDCVAGWYSHRFPVVLNYLPYIWLHKSPECVVHTLHQGFKLGRVKCAAVYRDGLIIRPNLALN